MKRGATMLAGGVVYLAVGVFAWWHVWAGGVSHTITTQGWGDPAQQVWYLGWVPHAIGAGINPLVSHAMFAPRGINLMANTSILFPALVISPVTALFGPLVAFNVLVVLAPAVSAFAAWRVICRYTSFEGGAFLAGLFYGFSPFVLNDLADGHLHVTLLVFPPLVLALVDDLVVSQRHSARSRGVLLGLVLAGQALTSLEVLGMIVITGLITVALLALWYRSEVKARLRRVIEGSAWTALTAGVLLAWPAWTLFRGPQRYKGTVFTSPESYVIWLKAIVWPKGGGSALPQTWAAYVGIPLLLVVAYGAIRFKSAVVRWMLVIAVVALVFGMGRTVHVTPGLSAHVPLPDRIVTRAPFLEDLLPVRFTIIIDLVLAVAFAVVLGELRERWRESGRRLLAGPGATVAATALGVVALVSPALGTRWPYPTRQVAVPAVYRSPVVTHLPSGTVLLAYPVMNGFAADPMIWQAETGYPYDMVAGYGFVPGPGPHPLGSLPASPITTLFGDADVGLLGHSIPPARIRAVRAEINSLGVSAIVLLPEGKNEPGLARILTRVLGRPPRLIDGAAVWTSLRPPVLHGS